MITPDNELIYSNNHLKLRASIVFFGYIFLFLAAGTELIDVTNAYFNIVISPRMALVILVLLQMFIWGAIGFYTTYDYSTAIPAILILLFVLSSYLIAETSLGIIFGEFSEEMRTINTFSIALNIFLAASYLTIIDYNKKRLMRQH